MGSVRHHVFIDFNDLLDIEKIEQMGLYTFNFHDRLFPPHLFSSVPFISFLGDWREFGWIE